MILNDYQLRNDLAVKLEEYQRDNNISPILLVENLLEKFLYDEGYIVDSFDDEDIKTPQEIYSERRSKFYTRDKKKNGVELYFENCYFGLFKHNEVEEVISKLLDFSDEELKELDKNNWEYRGDKYKMFIREKLDNPLLTKAQFIKNMRIRKSEYFDKRRPENGFYIKFRFHLNGRFHDIGQFNINTYSNEVIEDVELFLNRINDVELMELIKLRKNSNMPSAEFILRYMGEYREREERVKKKHKYVLFRDNGKILFVKNGYTFGTHDEEKLDLIWEFLNRNGWDKSYSTKCTGLKGKNYNEWLYNEIEKSKWK